MFLRSTLSLAASLAFLAGCSSTINQEDLEERTAQAIGRTVGQFTIADRTEETGGRVNYTAYLRSGGSYRCYLYGATGLQKAMSFGQTPHSEAICKVVSSGQSRSNTMAPSSAGDRGRSGGGECSSLARAAGRC
jgi:hypothetical protein